MSDAPTKLRGHTNATSFHQYHPKELSDPEASEYLQQPTYNTQYMAASETLAT